jgi:hypothetical protein
LTIQNKTGCSSFRSEGSTGVFSQLQDKGVYSFCPVWHVEGASQRRHILIKMSHHAPAGVAFRDRRGYRYQAVRKQQYLSRLAICGRPKISPAATPVLKDT